jgi:hypothetical protein
MKTVTVAGKAETGSTQSREGRRTVNPRPAPETQRPYVIHKGRVVDAIYVASEVQEWAGNPMIEALPRAIDVAQAGARLAHYPKYSRCLSDEPSHIRRLLLQNSMKSLFIPLDTHLDLHQRLQCAIRVGYSDRNPLTPEYFNQLESKLDEFDQYAGQYDPEVDNSATATSGFNILGLSGGGKSRTILRCLQLLPQTIKHSRYQGRDFTYKQLVWLKLDCPFDGNVKGLCIQFFSTVDAILGTNYRRNHAGTRRIIEEMLSDMALVAGNHCIGVLVVDEIQRLKLAKSGGAEKMLNFFVELVSRIGIPVILVGTYKGMSVLSGEFSQIRRGTGQGDMLWDRMDNDEQWHHFVESLWRFQYVRKDSNHSDRAGVKKTLSDVLYDETQGIIDFAIKVFMFAQERAMETGHERITAELIRRVAKDKLKIPRLILKALKQKDMRVLERFEDLYPSAMKNYLSAQAVEPQVSGKLSLSPEINALLEEYRQGEASQPQTRDMGEGGTDTPFTADGDIPEGEVK